MSNEHGTCECGVAVAFTLIFALIITSLIASIVDNHADKYWQHEAVKHNAAHYDTVTGEWKWNTKLPVEDDNK